MTKYFERFLLLFYDEYVFENLRHKLIKFLMKVVCFNLMNKGEYNNYKKSEDTDRVNI